MMGSDGRSIYQYSNMAPTPSKQTSIFGVVFFVSKSLLGIEGQTSLLRSRFLGCHATLPPKKRFCARLRCKSARYHVGVQFELFVIRYL